MSKEQILDTIEEWVQERGAAYIADEDRVKYHDSPTSRKSDAVWVSLTLEQMARTITVTRLPSSMFCKKEDCLAVFQEQARVFERTIKCHDPVAKHLFNYYKEGSYEIEHEIILTICNAMAEEGMKAMLLTDMVILLGHVFVALKIPELHQIARNKLLRERLGEHGFVLKTDQYRVMYKGKKTNVVIMHGATASDIPTISLSFLHAMATLIANKLR